MVKIKILTEEDKKKRAKKEKQKEILKKISNRIYKAVILLQIIVIAFIVSTPLFNIASTTIRFKLEEEKDKYRAGYPINFSWYISSSPSQAIIVWGDGTTDDINKTRSGSLKHMYDLQGRYTPTLLIWNSFGTLNSKSI